jgi:hypothetical protein
MFHLAQVNIARAQFPLDDGRMHGFTSRLSEINVIAETSAGFIWRWTDDSHPFDQRTLVNISVWDSVQALKDFTYSSAHVQLFRNRSEWFEKPSAPSLAMWWIPAGTLPTVDDAIARLNHIRDHGESAFAFTFRNVFPAPDAAAVRAHQA